MTPSIPSAAPGRMYDEQEHMQRQIRDLAQQMGAQIKEYNQRTTAFAELEEKCRDGSTSVLRTRLSEELRSSMKSLRHTETKLHCYLARYEKLFSSAVL